MQKHLILLFLPLFFFIKIAAQNVQITYVTPMNFFVCDTATFSVTLTNNGPATGPLSVTLGFPTGVEYVPGSVNGAVFAGGAAGTPVFSIADLAPNTSQTFSLGARASCALTDAINAGQQFTNSITASWPGGAASVVTGPYPIETPLLLIVGSTNNFTFAQLGQQVIRSFTIRNTRLGALDNFTFQDDHPAGGFSVSADPGTVLNNSPTLLTIGLSGADFQQIGDGDGLFELDEEITITETLIVTDCGIDLHQSLSTLTASWSCDGELCQASTSQATLNILPVTGKPKLKFEGVVTMQEDLCGQLPSRQHLRITNIGDAPAIGSWFQLFPLEGDGGPDLPWAGLDTATMRIDSAGSWRRLFADSATSRSLYDCTNEGPFFTDVFFTLPWLAPGASVVVDFDLYVCSAECPNDFAGWEVHYWLPKNCPPGEVEDGFGIGPAPYVMDVLNDPDWRICIKEPLQDDHEYPILFNLTSLLLTDSVGVLRISFRLPCGMSWGSVPFTLNGLSPVNEGVYPDADTTVQWFEFDTPIGLQFAGGVFNIRWDCDAVCPDVEQECLHFFDGPGACAMPCDADPDSLPTVLLKVVSEFRTDPLVAPGCGIRECLEYNFVYDCSGDSCVTPIEGWVEHVSQIRRTSLGLADNDGDRLPDPGGALDFSKIKLNRFMLGDTAETVLQGVVHSAQPGQSFENGLLRLYFDAHEADISIDTGTLVPMCGPNGNLIEPLRAVLRLRDAETGQVFICNLAAPTITCSTNIIFPINVNTLECADSLDNIFGMAWTWDISPAALAAAGCSIPSNFVFTEGDSIDLKVVSYFANPNLTDLHVNVRAGTFASVFNGYEPVVDNYSAPPQDFSCSCPYTLIQYTPVLVYLNRSKFYLPPCAASVSPMQQDFIVKLSFGDFFPYEYRPVVRARQLRDSVPMPVLLETVFLDSLELQEGPVIIQDAPLGTSVDGEIFATDLTTLPDPDEGYTLHFNQQFTASCNLNLLKPLNAGVIFEWLPPSPFAGEGYIDTLQTIDPVKDDTFGFIPIRPALTAFAPQPNLISPNNSAFWDFTMVSIGYPVVAPGTWVYPQSQSGLLSDFQLFTLPDLTPVPVLNGIFQLGEFPVGQVGQYRLVARNNSCALEKLYLYYGWDCDTLTSPNDFTCQRSNLIFSVQAQQAELEIDVSTPPGTVALCDTTDYHVVDVFNALYGAAYAPRLGFQLPAGLTLAAGTCQMAFPTGSSWVNIPDPQPQPGGWLGWELADLSAALAQQGLAGFQFAPDHSLSVRFRTLTSCGFETGEKILFRTWAEQNCGDTTNLLVKPGEPVFLDGVAPAYTANLVLANVGIFPYVFCNLEGQFAVQFSADGPTGNEDSLFVLLPPGALFDPTSYNPGPNAPASLPFIQNLGNQQLLQWPLPAGLPANTLMSLKFEVSALGQQSCDPDTLHGWTTQRQSAFCIADGTICSVQSTTSESALVVPVKHPQFEILSAQAHQTDFPSVTFILKNASDFSYNSGVLVQVILDLDGDGMPSPADSILGVTGVSGGMVPGFEIKTSYQLLTDLSNMCHLILAIDPEFTCICEPVWVTVPAEVHFYPSMKTVCPGEEISLGFLSQGDHLYSWLPAVQLSCADCAHPVFQSPNAGDMPLVFNYQFTETSGDCSATGEQQVTVWPVSYSVSSDTSVCAGQSVTLGISGSGTVEWSGPGIQAPAAPIQIVTPLETSIYTVKITTADNCVGVDSVQVAVLPMPMIALADDTLGVCGNATLTLDGPDDPDFVYAWSPAAAVSDSSIADPVFTGHQSTLLTLTVSLPGGCSDSDSVFVGFSENPVVVLSAAALTNCIGDTVQVSASGADTYEWIPSGGVICATPNCAEALLLPAQTTTYAVVGSNSFGCPDTSSVTVNVPGAVQNTLATLETCAGELVAVFDQMTDVAGLYCRTFSTASGCDSTHCITLTVNDTLYAELDRSLCPGGSVVVGGVTYNAPGRFCQTVPTVDGCDSTTCVVVTAASAPVLDTFFRIVIAPGETPVLSLPGGFAGYAWSPAEHLSCIDCPAPVFTPPTPAPDSVTYRVTVTNAAGCTAVAVYRVRVLPPCDPANVRMPDAFSPDGDGVNDVFRPVAQEGLEVILGLEIFNRWGEKVYAGGGANVGWDGRIDGKDAAVDTYLYLLEVLCDGEKAKRVGELSLLR